MQQPQATPLCSRRSSSSGKSSPSLTLDLSNIPPLTQPTPPSNTLLFTNLLDADVFRPENLATIRDLISKTAPIHSWAPLKSFRRIVVSFWDEAAAIRVRSVWDGEAILGERCRVYFGRPTPTDTTEAEQHLALPDAGKLFFISPPPSPPHGWEMRLEDAPNKVVHADDLAEALARLRHSHAADDNAGLSPVSPTSATDASPSDKPSASPSGSTKRTMRSRSSTLIYMPEGNGASPDLPAIAVHDMTDEPEPMSEEERRGFAAYVTQQQRPIIHTARPPIELMEH